MSVDQRKHTRFSVMWRAKLVIPKKGIFRGTIRNVSLGGGYLELPFALPMGLEFLMEVYPVLDGQIFPVRVKVKSVYDTLLSDARGHGIGVKLVQVAEPDKAVLKRAIDTLA